MEWNVHEDRKIVEIWMTRDEKNDPAIQARLQKLYDEYQKKKYLVAVFQSGSQDLYQNTRDLLAYNKKHSAERVVHQMKKAGKTVGMDR
ncbi:MAG: hypothetical protein PUD63_07750 [Clostridia bacterium]|nr:hypothetical protein [Clostridia bacterium]